MINTFVINAQSGTEISARRVSITHGLASVWPTVAIDNHAGVIKSAAIIDPTIGWYVARDVVLVAGTWRNQSTAEIKQGHSVFIFPTEAIGHIKIVAARLRFRCIGRDNATWPAGDLLTFTQYLDPSPFPVASDYIRAGWPTPPSWAHRGVSGSKLTNIIASIDQNSLQANTVHSLDLPLSVLSDLSNPIRLIASLTSGEVVHLPTAAATLAKHMTIGDVALEIDFELLPWVRPDEPEFDPLGKILSPRVKVITSPADSAAVFDANGIMQGAERNVAAGGVDIQRDGESSGSARLDIHDEDEAIGRWDHVQILMGYGAVLMPRFYGRVHRLDRSVEDAMSGSVVSLACVGQTAEILQIETTTPIYSNAYQGFGNWNTLAIWTRSRIVEDLCRIYGIDRRRIEPSTDIVYQRPFVQMRLADIFAEIAIPDFAKIGFNSKGEFEYIHVKDKPAILSIKEGETLLNYRRNILHEKIVNEVLIKGTSLDTVQLVQSDAIVGRYTRDIPPGVTFRAEKVQIEESFFDAELTHTATIQLPTAYEPTTVTGRVENLEGQFSNASHWNVFFPNPQNSTIMLPGANDVILNSASLSGRAFDINARFTPIVLFLWAFYEGSDTGVLIYRSPIVESNTVINLSNLNISEIVAAAVGGPRMIIQLRFTVFTHTNPSAAAFQNSSYNMTYRQAPGATGAITVTRNDAAIIAVRQMPKGSTNQYIFDVTSTYPSDIVKLTLEIRGRALRVATPELVFFASRDVPSISAYGSKSLEMEAASISTIEEARRMADAIVEAGKAEVETLQVECVGNPHINPSMFTKIECVNANPIEYLGAAVRDFYVLSVSDRFEISDAGYRWTQSLNLLPAARAILAIVQNFSLNPVKERAEIQSEFFSSFVDGQVVEVHDLKPFIEGQPDPQRYTVEILSANGDPANSGRPFRVARIGNAANEQFVEFDTVSIIFQDGERTRPQIVARSHVSITNNAPISMLCSSIMPNGSGGARIVTNRRHLFATGMSVRFAGTNSVPSLDGLRTVSAVISDTVFDVAVDVTANGFTGSVNRV